MLDLLSMQCKEEQALDVVDGRIGLYHHQMMTNRWHSNQV